MEVFIYALIGLSFPVLFIVLLIRSHNKHYRRGFHDGYNEEKGIYNNSYGRPFGVHQQSRYNSGYIDGQRKAKQEKR